MRIGGGLRDGVAVCLVQTETNGTVASVGSLTLSAPGHIPGILVGPTTASEAAGVPFIVSCSDDAVLTRYSTLKVTVQSATSATTSGSIVLVVGYTMDA